MTFVETSNLAGAALSIRHGNTSWTFERETTVRRLWKEGWSASQIAGELGYTTRNAVIGKLFRMGLTANSRLPGTMVTAPAPIRAPRKNHRPDGYRRLPLPKKPQGVPPAIVTPEFIAAIERNDAACTFAQLSTDTCRYPYGEPHDADFAFCGRSSEGHTYCSGHARICYQPSAPRRDKVSRR